MSNKTDNGNGTVSALPEEKVQRIGLVDLEISEQNTRHPKPADPDISELALSMKERGQTTPAIVRPHPKKKGKFEIAAGSRRWVAAEVAGLTTLDCVVRELDDNDFEELLLVENLQRVDPDPKAEVELIDRLIKRGVHTPEQISAHLGKSKHWAERRVRLLKVVPALRKLWQKGDLEHFSVDMISLLGSLPEETQNDIAKRGDHHWGLGRCGSRGEVQKFLDQNWLCRLDNAPFDLNDQRFFVSGCGPGCACSSAALQSLFQEDGAKEPPRCLKPECFQSRLKLANNAKMAAIKKEHGDLPIVAPGGWSGGQETAMFGKQIGVHAVHSYAGETLKDKEEKGAKKVLVWNPQKSTLRVAWLKKTKSASHGSSGGRDVKSATERLKERKAIKQGQRWLLVHGELDKALAEAGHKLCTEDLVDLVAVFGMPFKASGYSDETFVKRFNARQKGYPLDSSAGNLQPYERDAAHGLTRPKGAVTRSDALWYGLKIVLRSIMKPIGNVGQVPRKAYVMRFVAKLIKFPIEERKREADLKLPPSKSWGAVDIHTLEPLTKEQANKQFMEKVEKNAEISRRLNKAADIARAKGYVLTEALLRRRALSRAKKQVTSKAKTAKTKAKKSK